MLFTILSAQGTGYDSGSISGVRCFESIISLSGAILDSCGRIDRYVKLGLKKHADIYPSGGHLEGSVVVRDPTIKMLVFVGQDIFEAKFTMTVNSLY